MPKKIIIANWKMNLTLAQAQTYVAKVKSGKNIVLAAPFTFLQPLKMKCKNKVSLSGQNVAQFKEGPHTGEVSAAMLKEAGCSYCLVGHSERRLEFKETDEQINGKILELQKVSLTPVLCIGETWAQRTKKITNQVLTRQLTAALKNAQPKLIIAYEPVWAISTRQKGKQARAASLSDIQTAHELIRQFVAKKFGSKKLFIKVIYGGTVNETNSREILSLAEVEGALIGKASLKVSSFNAIIDFI